MEYENLIYNVEDGIATLTLNRPQKLNSFTPDMLQGMQALIREATEDEKVRVLVLTGTGRAFCTGADVKMLQQDFSRQEGRIVDAGGSHITLLLRRMNKPAIAAINGVTAGGAFDIACSCDIRIASERATFSSVFVRRGLMPGLGGTHFLPRLVGLDKACELLWTGDLVDAREAERIGLVTRVVPHDELESATRELAVKLVKGPPLAIAKSKQAIYKGLNMDLESVLDDVEPELEALRQTEDHREALAAFLEKREPVFKGR